MLRKTMVLLFVTGLLVAFTNINGGQAWWTTKAIVPDNFFATGELVLTTTPTTTLFNATDLMPSDVRYAPIDIINGSRFPLLYALTTSATNPDGKRLREHLILTIKADVKDCSDKGFSASGKVLYHGPLNDANFGDPNPLQDSEDRFLDVGAKEALCFRVELPGTAESTLQKASTIAEFTFHAEQN
jgi:hypothetical protein